MGVYSQHKREVFRKQKHSVNMSDLDSVSSLFIEGSTTRMKLRNRQFHITRAAITADRAALDITKVISFTFSYSLCIYS